jgi:CheY-like chemotaxis protein
VPAATAAPLQAREALPVEGRGRHVMYVDDDEALVYLVVRLLTRRGFKVSGFCEPALALQALRASPQDFDLLVTDYNMPGFSGLDLVREALLIRPQLPIALASGYVTAQMQREALACGARVVIHKPNDTQELCETVQRLIMGNDPLPAADGADPRLP